MIYEFLADGFEEIEAITPIDVLRRGKVDIKTVSVCGKKSVVGAHETQITADILIEDIQEQEIEGMILPGGMPGTENLFKVDKVSNLATYCVNNKKLTACICAAPIILGRIGLLEGKNACCYPGFEGELKGAKISNNAVCVDSNIITAKGPGVSLAFSFEILKALKGESSANKVRLAMQCTE